MTCPLPVPKWWQDYAEGRLTTPQSIYLASRNENPDAAQAFDRLNEVPDPGPTFAAPERLKAPNFIQGNTYLKYQDRADWSHADPRLMVWAATFTEMARKRSIPLYVHSAFRGEKEQNALVAKGNSKARYPSSAHNIGEAVDVVHGVFHWDMNAQEWNLLHVLGKLALDRVNTLLKADNKLSLTWGGSWRFYDPAHWEVSDYKSRMIRLPDSTHPVRMTPKAILAARERLLAGL